VRAHGPPRITFYVETVTPPPGKDPFDRILVAQAIVEGITLLTADTRVAAYSAPIRLVRAV